MIYGYIEDRALWRTSASLLMRETDINQNAGYFDSDIKNYYVDPIAITDNRTERLTIFANPLKDKIKLWFDNDKIVLDEPALNLTGAQWQNIFNIIEYTIYTYGVDLGDLETYITTNPDVFGTYNPNSLIISNSTTDVTCLLNTDVEVASSIRRFLQFEYINGAETVIIKLWIDTNLFSIEYPLYTITKVVLPCSPASLVNVTTANTINTIISSFNNSSVSVDEVVTQQDNSGVYIFNTTYMNSNLTGSYQMPFMVFYKGHQPSTIAMRITIRETLEAIPDIDPSVWPIMFPDLYTEARIYIIPKWDNYTTLPLRTIYPSITPINTIVDTIQLILPGLQPSFIDDYACVLTCDSSTMMLIAIPDPDNDPLDSLHTLHPTYTDVDATNTNFDFQEIHTRDFNIKLCNALSTLLGGTSTSSFTTIEEDGKRYLVFISNLMEYCILYRDSFPGL